MPINALWTEVMLAADHLGAAQARGAPVDVDLLNTWRVEYDNRVGRELSKLRKMARRFFPAKCGTFNPEAGTGHVRILLDRHRPKLRAWKQGKGGASYDEEVLRGYIRDKVDRHGICAGILSWRRAKRDLSTSIEGPLRRVRVAGDGVARLFWEFNIGKARTLRNSSSNPNSQNWPRRFRECIISRHRSGFIQQSDASQVEPRVMAHRSNCARMKELFHDPKRRSIYLLMAPDVFGRKIDKATDPMMYLFMKRLILATNYNASYGRLLQMVNEEGMDIDEDRVLQAYNNYQRRYPEIFHYITDCTRRVVEDHSITCLTGFVRHLPNGGPSSAGFKHIVNEAVNVDIQHTASWLTLMWMNVVEEIIADEKIKVELLTQVHDSNVHDVQTKKAGRQLQEASDWAIENLDTAYLIGTPLTVPLLAETGRGPNWMVASA